jgi:short-subunit dehydrogenase
MSNSATINGTTGRNAFIMTGPTSGIGLATALELARHGTVVLVGRNREKLAALQKRIEQKGTGCGVGHV